MFQSYNLIPQLTVRGEHRGAAANIRGSITAARSRSAAVELADLVGLGERLDHRPTQLSGGQQQRAGIARSLVNDPYFILADEPTGNLDSVTTGEIMDMLDAAERSRQDHHHGHARRRRGPSAPGGLYACVTGSSSPTSLRQLPQR